MFCRKQQSWVNVLSSLQDCDMKSVQSNTSVAIVGKWIAHNRHNTHINIDINIGTICDTRLNMRHNFQKPPFSTVHTTTWKCRFQIYPLWRAFSKSYIFLEKNAISVWCVLKRKSISFFFGHCFVWQKGSEFEEQDRNGKGKKETIIRFLCKENNNNS